MRVLKILNMVEEYGEGVDRMYSEMEARLMEPPHFAATPSSVTVTLYNRSVLSIEDQAWLALLGHLDLKVQERRSLVLARHEGTVTGRGGGARYVLSDEVVMRAGGAGVEARSRKRQMLLDEIRRRGSFSTAEAADFLREDDRALVRRMLDDLVVSRQVTARTHPSSSVPRRRRSARTWMIGTCLPRNASTGSSTRSSSGR